MVRYTLGMSKSREAGQSEGDVTAHFTVLEETKEFG